MVNEERAIMTIDFNALPSVDEKLLARRLATSLWTSGPGISYTDADTQREIGHREAIRVELRRRGYSADDVRQIESGEWMVLDGRGQGEKLDENVP